MSATGRGVFIALLRGVNVGGRRSLPMKELTRLCTELGWGDVRTYIQSGNVVFTAEEAPRKTLAVELTRALREEMELEVPVVVRGLDEWEKVAVGNPFLARGADRKTLHVAFLADRPSNLAAASLDPDRSPPDEFELRGSEIYLRFPNGVARTKLDTRYLERTLGTTSTARNWRTVLRIHEIARSG